MKATISALCIISAFLSTGSTLQCTNCDVITILDTELDYNRKIPKHPMPNCTGLPVKCSSEDAVCASIYVSYIKYASKKGAYFKRDCLHVQECNVSESFSSPGMNLSYSVTCCNTDVCTPDTPVLKEANTKKNGILCPAYFSEERESDAKFAMECTGEERSCMTFIRTQKLNMFPAYSSGCSTQNFCKKDRDLLFLSRPKFIEQVYCKKQNSQPNQRVGHFIWCPICHDYSRDTCYSHNYLCSPHEDACVFEHIRSIIDGREEIEVTKRCGKRRECDRIGSIRSLNRTMMINTTCCYHNACTAPSPKVLPIHNETNGMICPACFALNSDRCLGRTDLQCIGNENRCIHYMKTEKQDTHTVTQTLYGCATDRICEVGSSLVIPNGLLYKTTKTYVICNSAITYCCESYTFLMFTVTTLNLLIYGN